MDKIAQGRIWSGVDAKRLGLVDVFEQHGHGHEIAAKKASLEEYQVVTYPIQENSAEKLFGDKTEEVVEKVATNYLGEAFPNAHVRKKHATEKRRTGPHALLVGNTVKTTAEALGQPLNARAADACRRDTLRQYLLTKGNLIGVSFFIHYCIFVTN